MLKQKYEGQYINSVQKNQHINVSTSYTFGAKVKEFQVGIERVISLRDNPKAAMCQIASQYNKSLIYMNRSKKLLEHLDYTLEFDEPAIQVDNLY